MEMWRSVGEKNIYGIGMFCYFRFFVIPSRSPESHAAKKKTKNKQISTLINKKKRKMN